MLFETLKQNYDSFSGLLFWLTFIYLLAIILIAYFALSFLFDEEGVPLIRIAISYGSFMFMFILYFVNTMSDDVTGKDYTHWVVPRTALEVAFIFHAVLTLRKPFQ